MSRDSEAEAMVSSTEVAKNEDTNATLPTAQSPKLEESVENEILDCVANSSAIFKSQQKGEPELSLDEKRTIARELLAKSHSLFLAKFGEYMKKEHLDYFRCDEEDYEIRYHTKRLKRYFDNTTRQIDIKNRRYQALKMLVEKGEYFSETEMMKRNPLLYDHLIGQYLTEEQKKKRDNVDTTNITFVNLLLESIERDRQKSVKKKQEDAEDEVLEENDSDEDSDEDEHARRKKKTDCAHTHWGEMPGSSGPNEKDLREQKSFQICKNIPSKERQVLREEFVTHMYENFLNGKDIEFDYR